MKFTLSALFTILCVAVLAQTSDKELVQKTFDGYKSAILNDDAEKALGLIDTRTKKYYIELLEEIKNADSSRINSLSLLDKMTILSIRARAPREDIRKMKETDAFSFAVKNGMVGKDGTANNSIGEIVVDEQFAKAPVLSAGRPIPISFHFHKEEGQWKIDLTSLFAISNIAFKNLIAQSGQTENEFLFAILENLTGKKITSEIWKPI